MDEELATVVDIADRNPRKASRSDVVSKRLLHRGTVVYVFNNRGEVFLQRRSTGKRVYPGRWDCSAAGTVEWGETYRETARREVSEELGIKMRQVGLRRVGVPFRVTTTETDEFDQLFTCVHRGPFELQESEVAEGRWLAPDDVEGFIAGHDVTPWFESSWQIWKRYRSQKREGAPNRTE